MDENKTHIRDYLVHCHQFPQGRTYLGYIGLVESITEGIIIEQHEYNKAV